MVYGRTEEDFKGNVATSCHSTEALVYFPGIDNDALKALLTLPQRVQHGNVTVDKLADVLLETTNR